MDCYSLPTSLLIGESKYQIRNDGDYRVILDCFDALSDTEMEPQFRVYTALIIFYSDLNSIPDIFDTFGDTVQEAVDEMYEFFNCGKEDIGMKTPYNLIDWKNDSQMIAAAINNVARVEVRRESYIHWWTFLGYYMSIGESTLSTVVGIRLKIVKGKPLEKYEKEFRRNNPEYFNWDSTSMAKKEDDELLKSLWNH